MGTDLTIYEKKNFKQNEKGKFTYEVEELETFSSYVAAQLCSAIYGLDDLTNGSEKEIEERDIVAADTDVAEALLMAKEELKDSEDVSKQIEEFAEKLNKHYEYNDYKTILLAPSYYWTEVQNARVAILNQADREYFNVLQSANYLHSCKEQRVGELTETLEDLQEFIKEYELKAEGDRVFLAHFSY